MKTTGLVLLMLVGTAFGQVPADEAYRRLEEKKRAAASRPAAGAPATQAAAPARPATRPARYRLAAKAGAPEYVKSWIAEQGPRQRENVLAQLATEKATLQAQLDQAKEELKRLEANSNFRRTSGSGLGQQDYVDREAEAEWTQKYRKVRATIGELTRSIKQQEASLDQRLADAEADPKFMTNLVAGRTLNDLSIGKAGAIGRVTIVRIVDDANMVVSLNRDAGGMLWCRGFSTAGLVDDQSKNLASCIITGTIKDMGRTMFVAEPFDVTEWIERVPVP